MKNRIFISVSILITSLLLVTSCQPSSQKPVSKDAIDVIMSRKSVRSYLDRPVDEQKIEILLKAGMAAPSGKDTRPWEFIVVKDERLLAELAEGLPYAKMLASAPMAIVVCADTTKSSYWYVDCSAAAQNILLAAEALDLGAVWTATYPYSERMEIVQRLLHLPSHISSLCIIPLGYPAMPHSPKDKWNPKQVHYNNVW